MADKYFLAKKTDAKITAAQVEKLQEVAEGDVPDFSDTPADIAACLVAHGLMKAE